MTTLPLSYYGDSPQLQNLIEQYGCNLNTLNHDQKLVLRIFLNLHLWESQDYHYSLEDTWINYYREFPDDYEIIHNILGILEGTDRATLNRLLIAITLDI